MAWESFEKFQNTFSYNNSVYCFSLIRSAHEREKKENYVLFSSKTLTLCASNDGILMGKSKKFNEAFNGELNIHTFNNDRQ